MVLYKGGSPSGKLGIRDVTHKQVHTLHWKKVTGDELKHEGNRKVPSISEDVYDNENVRVNLDCLLIEEFYMCRCIWMHLNELYTCKDTHTNTRVYNPVVFC